MIFKDKTEFKRFTEIMWHLPGNSTGFSTPIMSLSLYQGNANSKVRGWDFPGDPVVKTSPSNAGGGGLIPGRGVKIPHAS